MSVRIFLSTVSDEFLAYREALRHDLTRHNVEVKVQEDFKDLGGDTLDKLDVYIAQCDAVVHLVGDMTGSAPPVLPLRTLRRKRLDLADKLPPLGEILQDGISPSYTQWEAWLALYHGKQLFIAKAADGAERGPRYAPTEASRAAQVAHLAGLRKAGRYPGHTFASSADLAKHIYSTGILDLLVQAYGEEAARERDIAQGFIREMATRVAGDPTLDFEGMQQAVRTAIDLYEKEIAGGQTKTNIDAIVDEALTKARSLVDAGKSGLARAALRKAADSMRREEEDRRERYVAGVTALYHRARDIALAAYDGEAAAEAIIALVEAVHGANAARVARSLGSEVAALYEYGRDHGSNVHLVAAIVLGRKLLESASSYDDRGRAYDDLGTVLMTLGGRERSTARLEEAVLAFREALKQRTRERVPLDWAATQNNLGIALSTLGERESGTARLDDAVVAFREALKELTRERVRLAWATIQNNLGLALARLGERESDTARLDDAVLAFREALKERTRERPLEWAMTQNNLGLALARLGESESGTARLDDAVLAFREALKERTRERVPLDWAMTQSNLGLVLVRLGERESGTTRLEQAVLAFRQALKELTRDRVPLDWAMLQNNLGLALSTLGERESGTARLDEAVLAYREALKEYTRENAPYYHDMAQSNLDRTLKLLEERTKKKAKRTTR
jgi:tetratricopeptide (TPR) repeat protein